MAGLSQSSLRVVSPDELTRQESEQARQQAEARQQQPVILGLSGYLRACWDAAKEAKQPIERQMLKAKRQRNGEYEADKLAAIKLQGGSEVFARITEVKCRSAESWIRDILLDSGDIPWALNPTPIPDLCPYDKDLLQQMFAEKVLEFIQVYGESPSADDMYDVREIMAQKFRFQRLEEAQDKADRMADKIKDQFAEGGWYNGFNEFVTDLTTYPAAFIKGPVLRNQVTLDWAQGADGSTSVTTKKRIAPEFERVDPFRIYPEPGITNINDGYIFQHHPMTRSDLSDLIGVPGYDDDAIRRLLQDGVGPSWFNDVIETQKNEEEKKFSTWRRVDKLYDGLEFWGRISGAMLIEWGMDKQDIADPEMEYDANVWLIGNTVIKAVLNYDPLGEKPYAKTSFFKIPGAFWGLGIPEMIEDIQNVCNAAVRSLVNNMGIASGPQVEVNVERLPPNEKITAMYPWKIWQVLNDPLGSTAPAIRFDQPDDRSAQLLTVFEKFSRMADEHSGIPAYVSGDISVTGAGRTSSGLSMLMGAAGKGIRQVVTHIDNDVIKVIVERQFVFNMRFDPDESIKGDLIVVPRGAVNLAVKETLNARRVEFLTATANVFDMEIIGKPGRAAILREVAKELHMDYDEIVPTREEIEDADKLQNIEGFKFNPIIPGAAAQQGIQQQQQYQLAKPTPTFPGGQPMGGAAGNTVSNRFTGGA